MTTEQYRTRSGLSIFLSFFSPHRGLFFLDLACALVVALIDLAYPIVSRYAMRTLLPQNAYRAFFTVMLVVVAAYALRALLYFVITYWGHTFGIRVEADIRETLFGHMQTLGFDFYDRNRTGHLMSRLTTDLFEITELAHHGPEDLFIAIVTITGALIVMFTIEWRLALVVCVLIPVAVFVIMSRRRAMGRASRLVKQKVGTINADIESCLSGMRTAKAFANESVEAEKFRRSNEMYKGSKKYFYQEMGIFNSSMEFFVSILSVAVVTVGGALIMQGRMDVVDLLTFTLYITTFVNPIRKLANFAEMFANGTAGLERFVEIMRTEPALDDAPDAKELSKVNGAIDVDHVSFAYEGELDVLHDVSLHVNPGETIAVVGPSGGGKSTVAKLIARFWDVTSGAITIGGVNIKDIPLSQLSESVSFVAQDNFLFRCSLLENIRLGNPNATDEQVKAAARAAHCEEFIAKLPQGYDTPAGEAGKRLSGGEKQRIAIARMMLKNAPIVILDEATAFADPENEDKIQHSIAELTKGKTLLVIAHRLSTIKNADSIVVLKNGKIEASGRQEELLETCPLYRDMWQAHIGAKNWAVSAAKKEA